MTKQFLYDFKGNSVTEILKGKILKPFIFILFSSPHSPTPTPSHHPHHPTTHTTAALTPPSHPSLFYLVSINNFYFRMLHKTRLSSTPLGMTQEKRRLAREKKIFFQFFITTIWLTIFDIPFIVIGYLEKPSIWLGYFVTLTYIINCSINGWVYLILNKTIRREVKLSTTELWKWCICS